MALPARSNLASLPQSATPDLRRRPNEEFVPITEAAQIVGKSVGHLRRQCAEQLSATGMAKKIKIGGSGAWHLHRSFHANLARACDQSIESEAVAGVIERDAQSGGPIPLASRYTAAQLATATAHAEILRDYRRLIASGATIKDALPSFLTAVQERYGIEVSYYWLWRRNENCPATERWDELIESLISKRGGDRRTGTRHGRVSPEAWRFFRDRWLSRTQPKIAQAWRDTRAVARMPEHNWEWCSLTHCKRLVKERITPSEACMLREGLDAWRANFGLKLEQNPNAWEAGQLWVGDHSRLDFFIQNVSGGRTVAVRPWVTSWIDWRTRKIVGWSINLTPSADTIRYALVDAIEAEGDCVPDRVVVDHGKDFESYSTFGLTKKQKRDAGDEWKNQTGGLLGLLGVDVHFALPYNHDGKARKERFYGTMHDEFCRRFESYCGAKPGDVEKPGWIAKQPERLPTLREARDRFPEFVAWYNHRSEHAIDDLVDDEGVRLSPAEAMRVMQTRARRLANPDVKALLRLRFHQPRAVGQLGISVSEFGQVKRYGAGHPALAEFVGRKDRRVHIAIDDNDVSRIHVFDDQFRLVCLAELNEQYGGDGPLSREHLKIGIERKRRHEKAAKEAAKHSDRRFKTTTQLAREAQLEDDRRRLAERAAAGIGRRDPNEPLILKPVQTPLDDASNDRQRAEFRQAAGAEFDDKPDDGDGESIFTRLAAQARDRRATGGGGVEADHRDDDDDDEPYSILRAYARGEMIDDGDEDDESQEDDSDGEGEVIHLAGQRSSPEGEAPSMDDDAGGWIDDGCDAGPVTDDEDDDDDDFSLLSHLAERRHEQ